MIKINKYEKGKINIAMYVFIIVGPGFILREECRSSKWVYFSIWSLCILHVEGSRPGERQVLQDSCSETAECVVRV